MSVVSKGTQAGVFDSKVLLGFLMDIVEKSQTIQRDFSACMDNLKRGRVQVDQAECMMTDLQRSFGQFSDTLDTLSGQALQQRRNGAQKTAQIEQLRRDIAQREARLSSLLEKCYAFRPENTTTRLQDLRDERKKVELQLTKVNKDIDQTYEDAFEVEDKLDKLRDVRQVKQEEAGQDLSAVQDCCRNLQEKKRRLLSLNATDNTVDLSGLYASPAEYRKLQVEIEELKHKQVHVDKHIQMQMEEREFLRQSAAAIMQKVHDLEMKVRQETGDHGFRSSATVEPNWHQDLGAPNVWNTSGPFTIDEINRLLEKHNRTYGTAHVTEIQPDGPSTSGETNQIVLFNDTSV